MKFNNDSIKNIDLPDLSEIIKSGKKTKIDLDKLKLNKVDVQFYYSDLKFKSSTEGFISHIAGIPIVYIDFPEKLGFFVLDNSLIFDITKQCFTVIVCENYIHTVNLKEFNNENELNITKNTLNLLKNITFKSPINPDMFKFEKCILTENNNNNIKKQIELIPSHLSQLGRSKLLERTTPKTNDALIIMLLLGFLVGIITGIVITLIVI